MRLKKFYYKKINSTNNKAHIQIRKGAENGIILAEFQTKGKGQRGNKWISFDGNLFMSIFFVIRNQISLNKITKINCLIVQKCVQKFTDYKVVIKKPNDILIKNQKIGGILQETVFKEKKKFLIVGIGINVNKSPKIRNYPTNFINFYTKKSVKRLQIFKLLCSSYEKKINRFS